MVAHNIADVSRLFAVMVRRKAFFQEDPPIVPFVMRLVAAPFDKIKVEPCLVMAALISRADTKSFVGMENAPCLRTFRCPSESGGLRNPQ